MAVLTIRNLDDDLKRKLRITAAEHGVSMEEQARQILQRALTTEPLSQVQIGTAIHKLFANLDVDEFELPPRGAAPIFADLQ